MELLKPIISLLIIVAGCNSTKSPVEVPKAYKDTTATEFFQRDSGWIASDGALSIPLDDQKVLWLFGDSHINDYNLQTGKIPCLFQVRNSAMVQPKGDWKWRHTSTLIGNGSGFKNLFKDNPDDNYWFWPASGFQLKDTIYVFLSNLKKKDGGGSFGWESGGSDKWGKMTVSDMKVVKYSPLQDFSDIDFGKGFIKDEEAGYIYAYGDKLDLITGILFVARISIKHPNAPWEFWNGKDWVTDVDKATKIAKGASNDINVSYVNGKYLLLSSEFSVGCDQGKKIYAAASDKPTGPFSQQKEIYTITDTLQGHYPFFYSVAAHPEYINDKNELLVTYCINGYGKCVITCIDGHQNPDYYRPKAIRVPFKLLF